MFDSPTNLLDTCCPQSTDHIRAKGKLRDSVFSHDDDVVRGVTWKVKFTDVSEEPAASIFEAVK